MTERLDVRGRTIKLRAVHEELQLTYVHGLADASEIEALVSMAESRAGWMRSPLKKQSSGARADGDARRRAARPRPNSTASAAARSAMSESCERWSA